MFCSNVNISYINYRRRADDSENCQPQGYFYRTPNRFGLVDISESSFGAGESVRIFEKGKVAYFLWQVRLRARPPRPSLPAPLMKVKLVLAVFDCNTMFAFQCQAHGYYDLKSLLFRIIISILSE